MEVSPFHSADSTRARKQETIVGTARIHWTMRQQLCRPRRRRKEKGGLQLNGTQWRENIRCSFANEANEGQDRASWLWVDPTL